MKLEEGQKLSLKDIAEFFNISYGSLRNSKESKLEELKYFCDYHQEGRKYIIDKVKIDKYISTSARRKDTDKEIFIKGLGLVGQVTTLEDITHAVKAELPTTLVEGVEFKTAYNRMSIAKGALYGKVSLDYDNGERGHFEMVWAKKVDNRWYELTEEETKNLNAMISEFYKKLNIIANIATYSFDFQNGDLTMEQYTEMMMKIQNPTETFADVLAHYESEYGVEVKRVTKFIDNAFKMDNLG